MYTTLTNRCHVNPNVPVYLHGDRQATHGSIVFALDFVKRSGIQRVAIAVDNTATQP